MLISFLFFLMLAAPLLLLGGKLVRRHHVTKGIGSIPHCAACNYTLTGLTFDLPSSRCPECGSPLLGKGVRHGELRPDWRQRAIGGGVMLGGIAVAAFPFTETFSSIDWYHHYPAWFVLNNLNSSTERDRAWGELQHRLASANLSKTQVAKIAIWAETRVPATLPWYSARSFQSVLADIDNPAMASIAWDEFDDRLTKKKLIDEQIRMLVDRALNVLAKSVTAPTGAARASATAFLGGSIDTGKLTAAQFIQFCNYSTILALRVRPVVGIAERFVYTFEHRALTRWSPFMNGFNVYIDGYAVMDPMAANLSSEFDIRMSNMDHLAPGTHKVVVHSYWQAHSPTANRNYGTVITSTTFEVVPDASVRLKFTPSAADLKRVLKASVRMRPAMWWHSNSSERFVQIQACIEADSIPETLAFEVFARPKSGQWVRIGLLLMRKDHDLAFGAMIDLNDQLQLAKADRVDLLFRSCQEAAWHTLDVNEIWSGELLYEDVPVLRPHPPDRQWQIKPNADFVVYPGLRARQQPEVEKKGWQ